VRTVLPDDLFSNKNANLVEFWSASQWKMFDEMFLTFRLFACHYVYFMASWYILWSVEYIFPALVSCTKKNLATLARPRRSDNGKSKLLFTTIIWLKAKKKSNAI
jgi:hypothetical protein